MSNRVGIIGTGRMGTAFARRLIDTGDDITVWNRTPERTKDATAAGAKLASSLTELILASDVVITSLTNVTALNEVLDALTETDMSDKLFIEMSTLLPGDQQNIANRLRQAGAHFVECPVGGTVGPALKGALLGFAGGTEQDVERAMPVLSALCKRVERMGDAGAGARMKLAINVPLAIYWATLAESLALLHDANLDGEIIASLMADSSAGPNVLKNRMDVVIKTINGEDQPGTFDIDGLSKDLKLALEHAQLAGIEMPLSTAAIKRYATAQEAGMGKLDGASLSRFAAGR